MELDSFGISMYEETPGCVTQSCEEGTWAKGVRVSGGHNNGTPVNMGTAVVLGREET